MHTIDLEQALELPDLATANSYGEGQKARAKLRLDEIDGRAEAVVVKVPEGVTAMPLEFLVGMLQPSVENLGGPEGFFEHYRFEANKYLVSQIRRVVDYSTLSDTKAVVGESVTV